MIAVPFAHTDEAHGTFARCGRRWERARISKNLRIGLEGEGPAGHRLNDTMFAIVGETLTPADVLDVSARYTYDSLTVD